MPGKRNPTIAEVLAQAAMRVLGNDTTVSMAGGAGTFELNVAKPVLIHAVLQSIRVLADSTAVFTARLVRGLDVDHERLRANVDGALLLATALNPVLGYDRVVKITALAERDGISPKEAAVALGLLTAEDYERHVDSEAMAHPHRASGAL
jgi:fumarate hydratase class II